MMVHLLHYKIHHDIFHVGIQILLLTVILTHLLKIHKVGKTLQCDSARDVNALSWYHPPIEIKNGGSRLHVDLSNNKPMSLSILLGVTKTRVPRLNAHMLVSTCVAILLKSLM